MTDILYNLDTSVNDLALLLGNEGCGIISNPVVFDTKLSFLYNCDFVKNPISVLRCTPRNCSVL